MPMSAPLALNRAPWIHDPRSTPTYRSRSRSRRGEVYGYQGYVPGVQGYVYVGGGAGCLRV